MSHSSPMSISLPSSFSGSENNLFSREPAATQKTQRIIWAISIVFSAFSFLLLVFGVMMMNEGRGYEKLMSENSPFFSVTIFIFAYAVISFFLGIFGCYSALSRKFLAAVMLGTLCFLAFAVQLSGIVITGVYVAKNESMINKTAMMDSFDNRTHGQTMELWNNMEALMDCCGFEGPEDYEANNYNLSLTCCGTEEHPVHNCSVEKAHEKGCLIMLDGFLKLDIIKPAAMSVIGLFLEIGIAVLAFYLAYVVRKNRNGYEKVNEMDNDYSENVDEGTPLNGLENPMYGGIYKDMEARKGESLDGEGEGAAGYSKAAVLAAYLGCSENEVISHMKSTRKSGRQTVSLGAVRSASDEMDYDVGATKINIKENEIEKMCNVQIHFFDDTNLASTSKSREYTEDRTNNSFKVNRGRASFSKDNKSADLGAISPMVNTDEPEDKVANILDVNVDSNTGAISRLNKNSSKKGKHVIKRKAIKGDTDNKGMTTSFTERTENVQQLKTTDPSAMGQEDHLVLISSRESNKDINAFQTSEEVSSLLKASDIIAEGDSKIDISRAHGFNEVNDNIEIPYSSNVPEYIEEPEIKCTEANEADELASSDNIGSKVVNYGIDKKHIGKVIGLEAHESSVLLIEEDVNMQDIGRISSYHQNVIQSVEDNDSGQEHMYEADHLMAYNISKKKDVSQVEVEESNKSLEAKSTLPSESIGKFESSPETFEGESISRRNTIETPAIDTVETTTEVCHSETIEDCVKLPEISVDIKEESGKHEIGHRADSLANVKLEKSISHENKSEDLEKGNSCDSEQLTNQFKVDEPEKTKLGVLKNLNDGTSQTIESFVEPKHKEDVDVNRQDVKESTASAVMGKIGNLIQDDAPEVEIYHEDSQVSAPDCLDQDGKNYEDSETKKYNSMQFSESSERQLSDRFINKKEQLSGGNSITEKHGTENIEQSDQEKNLKNSDDNEQDIKLLGGEEKEADNLITNSVLEEIPTAEVDSLKDKKEIQTGSYEKVEKEISIQDDLKEKLHSNEKIETDFSDEEKLQTEIESHGKKDYEIETSSYDEQKELQKMNLPSFFDLGDTLGENDYHDSYQSNISVHDDASAVLPENPVVGVDLDSSKLDQGLLEEMCATESNFNEKFSEKRSKELDSDQKYFSRPKNVAEIFQIHKVGPGGTVSEIKTNTEEQQEADVESSKKVNKRQLLPQESGEQKVDPRNISEPEEGTRVSSQQEVEIDEIMEEILKTEIDEQLETNNESSKEVNKEKLIITISGHTSEEQVDTHGNPTDTVDDDAGVDGVKQSDPESIGESNSPRQMHSDDSSFVENSDAKSG